MNQAKSSYNQRLHHFQNEFCAKRYFKIINIFLIIYMNQAIKNIQDPNIFLSNQIQQQHKIAEKNETQIHKLGLESEGVFQVCLGQNFNSIQKKQTNDQIRGPDNQDLKQRPISFMNNNFVISENFNNDLSIISFKNKNIKQKNDGQKLIDQQSSQSENLQQQQKDKMFIPLNQRPHATFARDVSFDHFQIPYFQEIDPKNEQNAEFYQENNQTIQRKGSYESDFKVQPVLTFEENQGKQIIQENTKGSQKIIKTVRSGTLSSSNFNFVSESAKVSKNLRRNTSSNLNLSSNMHSTINNTSSISEMNSKNEQNKNMDQSQRSSFMHLGKKMQSQGIVKTGQNKYQEITFRISDTVLQFENKPLLVSRIWKVKIFPHNEEVRRHAMIKILTKLSNEPIIFGLKRTKYGEFPLSFYTFAKIIIKRLKQFGIHHTTDWELSQKKPNIFLMPNILLNKTKEEKQINYQHVQQQWKTGFKKQKKIEKQIKKKQNGNRERIKSEKSMQKTNRSVTSPTNGVNFYFCASKQEPRVNQIKMKPAKTFIHGMIYKKSKYLSYWQRRYVIINELGIYSYRCQNESNFSVAILTDKIRQLWTNFSILYQECVKVKKVKENKQIQEWNYQTSEHNDIKQIFKIVQRIEQFSKDEERLHKIYLIIKIKHAYGQKVQFAIPVCNFDSESYIKNWLYAFFKVLPVLKK